MQTERVFQPLGEVLKGMIAAGELVVESVSTQPTSPESTRADSEPGPETFEPSPIGCPRCRGSRWLRRNVELGDPNFGKPVRCDCPAAIAAAQQGAGLADEQRHQVFDTFSPRPGTEEAVLAAVEWADDPVGWLVLLGPPGTGKTHLVSAITNRLIERGQRPSYWPAVRLLNWLRAGMDPAAEVSYAARLEDVIGRSILVLDDVGVENTSPFVAERWNEILDARYVARLPTVISSNLTRDGIERELGERIVSRLSDKRLCRMRGLSAADYRPLLKRELAPARLPYADGEPF